MINLKYVLILISFTVFSQQRKTEIKYFDKNYNKISKRNYNWQLEGGRTLGVVGDSINHRVVVERKNEGVLNNKKELDSLLETIIDKIDSESIQVIFYYPGEDPCNSSGTATPEMVKHWHETLRKKMLEIAKVESIYICKTNEGLFKKMFLLPWHKDPNGIVEKLFFKYHYPCSSFVAISPTGEYISYFGEYSHQLVLESVKKLKKKKNKLAKKKNK